ncbi:cell division topological specificity factor MinE [soil metagenome]
MSFFAFLLGEKKKTASVAKERLQIILAHERSSLSGKRPDYLPELQRELLAVISKYVSIRPEDLKVHVERQDDLEVLEVKIELPDAVKKAVQRPVVPAAPAPAAASAPKVR